LSFNHFDLSPYKLTDIPGLLQTPFVAFVGWQNAGIDDIPGLRAVPWSKFIRPPLNANLIGVVQLADSEDPSGSSISGSDLDGYEAECPEIKACPSITFTRNSLLEGKHWIAGSAQLVKGGRGDLAQVNAGLEPTGRNLYNSGFKVVLSDITPTVIKSALYFHRCQRQSTLFPTSCSPYGIGPVPFQSFHPGDPMLVGIVNSDSSAQEASLNFVAPTDVPKPTIVTPPFWQEWLSAIAEACRCIFHLG
jgi:hypothetical protein